jgi:RNA polymerase sigma-70 factor, ECF subfamily
VLLDFDAAPIAMAGAAALPILQSRDRSIASNSPAPGGESLGFTGLSSATPVVAAIALAGPQADLRRAFATRNSQPQTEGKSAVPSNAGHGLDREALMQTAHALTELSWTHPKASLEKISDEALIRLIAAGDEHALEILYARYNVRVYRFILRLTRNVYLAEDLVSEVFFDVWRQAAKFEGKSQVSTWLLAIARYKAVAALRCRPNEYLDSDAAAAIADPSDDPETLAHNTGRNAIIRNCLAQLSSLHREVIDLVYYHEKSVEEVARIVGVPASTVKTRMFYARSQIARLLKEARVDRACAC